VMSRSVTKPGDDSAGLLDSQAERRCRSHIEAVGSLTLSKMGVALGVLIALSALILITLWVLLLPYWWARRGAAAAHAEVSRQFSPIQEAVEELSRTALLTRQELAPLREAIAKSEQELSTIQMELEKAADDAQTAAYRDTRRYRTATVIAFSCLLQRCDDDASGSLWRCSTRRVGLPAKNSQRGQGNMHTQGKCGARVGTTQLALVVLAALAPTRIGGRWYGEFPVHPM
jgi:hypothetical protein